MEKTLRVLGSGEEGHGHSHSHAHPAPLIEAEPVGESTGVEKSEPLLNQRKKPDTSKQSVATITLNDTIQKGPSKLSAYLNLFGDFVHNM